MSTHMTIYLIGEGIAGLQTWYSTRPLSGAGLALARRIRDVAEYETNCLTVSMLSLDMAMVELQFGVGHGDLPLCPERCHLVTYSVDQPFSELKRGPSMVRVPKLCKV